MLVNQKPNSLPCFLHRGSSQTVDRVCACSPYKGDGGAGGIRTHRRNGGCFTDICSSQGTSTPLLVVSDYKYYCFRRIYCSLDDVVAGCPIPTFIIAHKHPKFNMIREFFNRHQNVVFRNDSCVALQLGFAPRTLRGLVERLGRSVFRYTTGE